MYCPRCSQQQINGDTRFCSKCGFLMHGMSEIVANGGLPREILDRKHPKALSPRRRGLKQGGLLFLSGGVIVPVLGLLTEMMNGEGYIVGLAAILTFLAGFLRMLYALIFQSGIPTLEDEGIVETLKNDLIGRTGKEKALPAQQNEPIPFEYQVPVGNWRETADLQQTNTTKETKKH